MRRLGLLIAALSIATPAAAQYSGYGSQPGYGNTMRPDNGSPTSRAGSWTNPYVVQQQGRTTGTMYEARPSQPGGAHGGSYSNPYVYQPNRYR